MSDHPLPSWAAGRSHPPTVRQALERVDVHRVIVSLHGLAEVLRDITAGMDEGEDLTDIKYVAGRLDRIVPVLVEQFAELPSVSQRLRGNLSSGATTERRRTERRVWER